MLNIALCSNDSSFLGTFSKSLEGELGEYSQGLFRLHKIVPLQTTLYDPEYPFDLCVVDITDGPAAGMEFVRSLQPGISTEVVVIAPNPDWAMEAYDSDVIAYFLSPPNVRRLSQMILRRFIRNAAPQEIQCAFRTAQGRKVLSASHIVYVEYSNHRLLIHTDTGKQLTTTTLRTSFAQAAEELLADRRFIRVHASFIVNLLHVSQFDPSSLTMDTGVTVPVSYARRKEVRTQFNRYFSHTA